MSDSLRIADSLFDDAEALVERIEHASRMSSSPQSIYDQITGETLPVASASTGHLWIIEHGERQTLSTSGISIADQDDQEADVVESAGNSVPAGPRARWTSPLTLVATEQLGPNTMLGLTLGFNQPVDSSLASPLGELAETILELAAGVLLRHRFTETERAPVDPADHGDVVDALNGGLGLGESLVCVATTLARETNADRVAVFRSKGAALQMIVSSTQPRVDRRARQVRLLEQIVSTSLRRADRFRYVVGDPDGCDRESTDARLLRLLEQYLADSGVRELQVEAVDANPSATGGRLAAITLERFRLDEAEKDGMAAPLDQLREPAFAAIRRAFQRDQLGWGLLAGKIAASGRTRRIGVLLGVLLLIAAALAIVPGDFSIPVEGRLVTAKYQRLFAPAAGTVIEMDVVNGQEVEQGQPLLRLRSVELDQQQRQLEGALATAKSKLAVVTASRSRSAADRGSTPNSLASSDEQVLKTEVKGLQAQLDLVLKQQSELTLHSPIKGYVDRWDLQQSLTGRPVMHGQFLLNVVSSADGWIVELDIPDDEVQYVAWQQAKQPCDVTFRLRSNPQQKYDGTLEQVSDVTQMDSTGRAVVRGRLAPDTFSGEMRFGATVIANVHCGSRPLAFIWFRSVIQWARQLDWFSFGSF